MNNTTVYCLRRKQAFTLVEMLVVAAIIAILTSLLLPSLSALRDRPLRMQAGRDLDGFTMAINQYIIDYGILGSDSDMYSQEFRDRPLFFLFSQPYSKGQREYFEIDRMRMLSFNDGAGYQSTADPEKADNLADPWGNPYVFIVRNITGRLGLAPDQVWIYTYGRDGSGVNDGAQGRYLRVNSGEWRTTFGADAVPDESK
ncbi:MAG: prepilin-type N-terminal cleavage/methylation domain-containing protein [Planctomycetota bacterium]|nr:MAG: prepilin-type N-terminal cleavage/methylation domain-containing protein [Planctomycetota bacterium]